MNADSGIRAGSDLLQLKPVRQAYQQAAGQLRDLILTGRLPPDERLPTEEVLARQLGVSRATVREALRSLAAEGLIRTVRGASGGSFVARPNAAHISASLGTNIGLLAQAHEVSLAEFLEARECLEVPASRFAAVRRRDADLKQLRASIPGEPMQFDTTEQFRHNRDFHSLLVGASYNTVLQIATAPIFTVLQTNLQRSHLDAAFLEGINRDHRAILDAVEQGDAERAAEEMHAHLEFLRPTYEQIWIHAHTRPDEEPEGD
jgi:GntR family transcriptional repressor for pyruvate dehydrogenase complex